MIPGKRCGPRGVCAAGVCLLASALAHGQLRVANWNITDYTSGRVADIQTAVYGVYNGLSLSPDIMMVEEIMTSAGMTSFLAALNAAAGSPGDWDGRYVAGPNGNEGQTLLFRTSKIVYVNYVIASQGGNDPLPPRNCIRFRVLPVGYTSNDAALFCYTSHMKAGSTSSDQARRLTEAQNIRTNAESLVASLPNAHFLFGADMNMYSSTEGAYVELTGSQANNDGRFFDPIKSPGTWHDSSAFRFIHTQDPIATNAGMDDRYDQIVVCASLIDGDGFEYIGDANTPYSTSTWNDANHSYRAWGNDGTSFNQGLTTTGNTMVGPAIAQALINCATTAGGHLPVFMDLRVPPVIGSDASLDFGLVVQGSPAPAVLQVWNDGNVACWNAAGIADLRYSLAASSGFGAPGGTFVDAAGGGVNQHTLTMSTATPGLKSGTLTINSNAPDEPSRVVTLSGEVFAAHTMRGDANCDGRTDFDDINPFVTALVTRTGYESEWPSCRWLNGDIDGNGTVDFDDINPFVALLVSP